MVILKVFLVTNKFHSIVRRCSLFPCCSHSKIVGRSWIR